MQSVSSGIWTRVIVSISYDDITPRARDKSKFSWLALLFKHFFIKIQPNMSEQETTNAETKPKTYPK